MNAPIWVAREAILAVHDELLAEFGGQGGIRDTGLFDSALARPENRFAYGESAMPVLAAAYAFGIVKNHPFIDGNKRIGFMAAVIFLERNGWRFAASEVDAVIQTLGLAAGEISEAQYADWLAANSTAP